MAYQKVPTTDQIKKAQKSKKSGGQKLDDAKRYEHSRGSNMTRKMNLKSNKNLQLQDYHVDILKGSVGKKPKNPKSPGSK